MDDSHLGFINYLPPLPPELISADLKELEPWPPMIPKSDQRRENTEFQIFGIFDQFLDFLFFYGRFGPREGFHRLPRTRAIIFQPLMPQTDPPRPISAPKLGFLTYYFELFSNIFKKNNSHTDPQTKSTG